MCCTAYDDQPLVTAPPPASRLSFEVRISSSSSHLLDDVTSSRRTHIWEELVRTRFRCEQARGQVCPDAETRSTSRIYGPSRLLVSLVLAQFGHRNTYGYQSARTDEQRSTDDRVWQNRFSNPDSVNTWHCTHPAGPVPYCLRCLRKPFHPKQRGFLQPISRSGHDMRQSCVSRSAQRSLFINLAALCAGTRPGIMILGFQ